ncbi:MAG: 4-(cytidine 5'-diphospho)-2-C-methyl-D-erythritol kinase [Bacteroidaceae bacterium]|nr:4-(cytidine 5'-diphospho)-2-C-methyl-D-erythritol kinase [Bacteroidaceae bacterium]
METKETFPIAKINIGLYVTRRREDGYHDLETIFYPIPLHDNLSISSLKMSDAPYQLQTAGHKIEGNSEGNLIVKVYKQLAEEFDLPALDIYLYKRIPIGAGLGGGSSDAAAMIKLLNETFDLGLSTADMERRVARLGADCAFFVQGKPAFATGIGDILTPIELSLSGMHLVLVKPDIFVSTKEAYGGIVPATPEHDLLESIKAPIAEWRHTVSNDFEKNVFRLYPEIAAIKQTLYDMGAVYASMSGSGSTVFALFQHAVEEAERVFDDCFVWQSKL